MAYNKHENSYEINETQLETFLADTLAKVESDSDPDTLNALKKIFKKNIPFTRRMYVAAYLVKQATSNVRGSNRFNKNERFSNTRNTERTERRSERTDRSERTERTERAERTERTDRFSRNNTSAEKQDTERTERAPRVQIDPSLATTIFIGIGRNRRVYPRDLVGLLISVAGLERDRIGDIRVLANYSFIQLFTDDCEKTIAALNGYEYRGRKLSVSYSRQKDEDEAEESSAEEKTTVTETADKIPENVTNESHAVNTESAVTDSIAAEQKAFAASQSAAEEKPVDIASEKPFTETTDDGQIKSHFTSTNYQD